MPRPTRKTTPTLSIGDRVEAGKRGTEDHDTGRVFEIVSDEARVGWDSGVSTWALVVDLRKID